ncbi:hypothetical protein QN219_04855 [Sinorhizobium sp. 7-81]|uniref:hypothetical protein n=1 Tax=Sinorhizobium sp. 8-89 TaxID=3049089 RepID=UPI0024C24AF1|nr:hypothetical protein [Sinorhizobium sp. 8-89]MDK1489386.1 hypothetical protein [Sinorhizobium sp. 8-89]
MSSDPDDISGFGAAVEVVGSPLKIDFRNCTFGGDIGLYARGNVDLSLERPVFAGTRQAMNIQSAGSTRVTGSRIIDPLPPSRGKSQVGYERPNGPPLPAMCPRCHSVFPSKNYNIGSSRFYGFDNEEVCPSCGCENAKLANGLFVLAKETIEVLQGEPLTYAMLAALSTIAADFIEGKASAPETADRLKKVNRKLGRIFAGAINYGAAATGLLAFWFMIFPSHLAPIHALVGEGVTSSRNAQIETICLETFGEAARCRFLMEMPNDKKQRDVGKKEQVPLDTPLGNAPEKAVNGGTEIELPEAGPVPSARPKSPKRKKRREHRASFGRSRTR